MMKIPKEQIKSKDRHFRFTDDEDALIVKVTKAFQKASKAKRPNMTKMLVFAVEQLGLRIK